MVGTGGLMKNNALVLVKLVDLMLLLKIPNYVIFYLKQYDSYDHQKPLTTNFNVYNLILLRMKLFEKYNVF